jgi:hypothetical protein
MVSGLTSLRTFSNDVGPCGGPKVEVAVDGQLGRFVGLKSDVADEGTVS